MRVTQIRSLLWGVVFLVTAGSFGSIYAFYVGDYRRPPLSHDDVERYLDESGATAGSDVARAPRVVEKQEDTDLLWQLPVTGKPYVEPEAVEAAPPVVAPLVPLADQVRVLQLVLDASPSECRAFLEFPKKSPPGNTTIAGPGQTLAAVDAVVKAIDEEGVLFEFAGKEERLAPTKLKVGAAPAAASTLTAKSGARAGAAGAIDPSKLDSSTQDGNTWYVAPTDLEEMRQKAESIFEEVALETHVSAKNGQPDGIEIKSITPGSIAERFGAEQGDILMKVNGNPVPNQSALLEYLKKEKANKTFVVEYERDGAKQTTVFRLP
jgi:hypothetical protein